MKISKQLLLCGSLLALVGCAQKPQTAPVTGYNLVTLQPEDRTIYTSYSATIQGRQDIAIYPQVSGYITKLAVTEGQQVKKGQTLFIIDQVPYQAALNTAVANVKAAEASLATAKLHYDALKRTLSEQKLKNHPARYTLAEIVNLHDDSFDFEPINRVLFGVDTVNFLHQLGRHHHVSFTPQEGQQYFDCIIGDETKRIWIADPSSNVVTGTVQNFIDHYIQEFSGKVDYVHGENIVRQLAAQVDNIGILFPSIPKQSLFETVLIDGTLPRKTFSMGQASDKRFYLECRKIKP